MGGADAAGIDQQAFAVAAALEQGLDVVVVVFQAKYVQQLRLRHKAGDVGENRFPLLSQSGLQRGLVGS